MKKLISRLIHNTKKVYMDRSYLILESYLCKYTVYVQYIWNHFDSFGSLICMI